MCILQAEQDSAVSEVTPHIANIGRMVEDMENKIRNTLNDIYFGKFKSHTSTHNNEIKCLSNTVR